MSRKEDLLDPDLFGASLNDARNVGGYLGDIEFVGALLRLYAKASFDATEAEGEDMVRMLALAKKYAGVLLGDDSRYVPVAKWNHRQGGLVAFLNLWAGIDENDPQAVVTGALLRMFSELLDVAAYAGQEGVLEEQWHSAADEIIERYSFLMLGVTPAARDIADVPSTPGKVQDE